MEKELQSQCNNLLRDLKIWYYHRENSGHTCKSHSAGLPDLLFATKGKFFAFELKSKGGVISDKQKKMLKELYDAGFITRVIYSFESFYEILKEYGIIK